MQTFTATFANGEQISRDNSTGRAYTHGWATFTANGAVRNSGFSASRQGAERAARNAMGYVGSESYEVAQAVSA